MSSQGNIAFASGSAVFEGVPGKLGLIAKDGDPISGLPGNVLFSSYTEKLAVNNLGEVAFIGSVKGALSGQGIFASVDGDFQKVWMGSEYDLTSPFSFSDKGLVMAARTQLLFWDKKTTQIIAQNGQALDLYPGCVLSFSSSYGSPAFVQPRINNTGDIVFGTDFKRAPNSTATCPASAMLRWNDGKWSTVVDTLQSAPNMPDYKFQLAGPTLLNDAGGVTFTTDNTYYKTGYFFSTWYKLPNQTPQLIAISGETVKLDYFTAWLSIASQNQIFARTNNKGQVLVVNQPVANAPAVGGNTVFSGEPRAAVPYIGTAQLGATQLTPLVSVGQQPPGTSRTTYFDEITGRSINDLGDVIIRANITDAATGSKADTLWYADQSKIINRFWSGDQPITVNGKSYKYYRVDWYAQSDTQRQLLLHCWGYDSAIPDALLLMSY
ncbi:MAG: hypothetical protein RL497_1027 [Pseudomonadota bacterium]